MSPSTEVTDSAKPQPQPNKSFRHLFSFGGADVKPVPKPAPAPAPVPEAAPSQPTRKRPREEPTASAPPIADLSDPEDVDDEVLSCARAFCRGERSVAAIRSEWFDGGRQERLRNDLRITHRKLARGMKPIKVDRAKVKSKK